MPEYTVHVTALGELTEADIDRIIDALKNRHAPVVSGGAGYRHYSVTLSLQAASLPAAFERSWALLDRVYPIRRSDLLDWRIHREGKEVSTKELPVFPEFVGVSEVAELLGVSKQRAWTLARRPDFPSPARVLKATPVWLKRSITAWREQWERKSGRPRKRVEKIRTSA
jgi:predicted DNA-binding transcriptional regulator AlpA